MYKWCQFAVNWWRKIWHRVTVNNNGSMHSQYSYTL